MQQEHYGGNRYTFSCVCKPTDKFEKQADTVAILNIGSRGLIGRGFLNPLLEHALRNGIEADYRDITSRSSGLQIFEINKFPRVCFGSKN